MMGPWETAPPQVEEEEIDIFAELGAMRPAEAQPAAAQLSVPTLNTSDPLAMLWKTMTNHQCWLGSQRSD